MSCLSIVFEFDAILGLHVSVSVRFAGCMFGIFMRDIQAAAFNESLAAAVRER